VALSLLDVVPLVADGLGVRLVSPQVFRPWPPSGGGPLYAYSTTGGPFLSVRENNRKTIVDARYGDVEIYDLAADPHEKRDLGQGLTEEVANQLQRTPLPWNPLMPLDQRFRRAGGGALDLCPPAGPPAPAAALALP
jgi:hypothetical protein